MKTQEMLQKYIKFFEDRGHKLIPNVSLVPEGDSTLLFVNSGMFPLVPYLTGEKHPLGSRLVNIQRALRFKEDLENVGFTPRHTVAFHMIGNWSLGDYFKEEQLHWFYEFIFDELHLDKNRVFATVYEGDSLVSRDDRSAEILKRVFTRHGIDAKEGEKIFFGGKDNWWKRGDAIGELGGPSSETFYYIGQGDPKQHPLEDEDNYLEIGNSVFLQYKKTYDGWEELKQKNVDFGGGLERLAMVLQEKKDIFETDNFWPLIEKIQEISKKSYYENFETTKAMRIIADHIRASVFLSMDGVYPSNKDQGYVLRRLLRRMVRFARVLGIESDVATSLVGTACDMFSWMYPVLVKSKQAFGETFADEEAKFSKTLFRGRRAMEKAIIKIDTNDIDQVVQTAFNLYQSVGYPHEIFYDDLVEKGVPMNSQVFEHHLTELIELHQQQSREGAEHKFKGGLADHSESVVKYHTATHLLQRGLISVLGPHVKQIGSNITGERLRFDFTHVKKLSPEEIKLVQDFTNGLISHFLPVKFTMMPIEKAKEIGALFLENETYPDVVKVYYVGESIESAVSKEFCGGPHVQNTSELSELEIYKQDKIGEGKLRIYARFVI